MKILHIINTLEVGGAERLLVDSLPIVKQLGHDVRVLELFAADSDFERQLRNAGVQVEALHMHAYNPMLIFALRKHMQWADVVHTHLFPSQYWAALARNKKTDCVLVTTEHSTSNTRARYKLTTLADKCIYSMYDGIICISDATLQFMCTRTPQSVEMTVVENGIVIPDASTTNGSDTKEGCDIYEGWRADDFIMLQVARLSEQKNQDCVIRALTLLPDNIHAVFVGYGPRLDTCRQLAERLNVSHRTHFLGKRGDIGSLWQKADIGVMSSHWEGFGLAAVEGMAQGKPVLASNVPGLAEVVEIGDLLFTPDNEQELADKVLKLYNDPALRLKLAEMCRTQASKYDIRNMATRYLEFYKKLLERK